MSDTRWHQITPSEYPWEREALAFLLQRLPDHEPYRAWANLEFIAEDGSILEIHMVPADFTFVDALPLTPSGKVDRAALRAPLPAGEPAPAAEPDGDLENEIEELVAGIWQDLLKRGSIGRDDNLFDVGAHSILAIEFASRVYDALGIEIPLRLAFEAPTVRRLGAAIQELLIEQLDSLTDEEAELLAE
jgi:acyl carrier protein